MVLYEQGSHFNVLIYSGWKELLRGRWNHEGRVLVDGSTADGLNGTSHILTRPQLPQPFLLSHFEVRFKKGRLHLPADNTLHL